MTATQLDRPRRQPPEYTSPGLGLGRAFRLFAGYRNPRLLGVALPVVVGLRIALGHWTWSDLLIVGFVLGFEPFTEWLTHVYLLHWKPRVVLGVRLDPLAARKHRAHHRDPKVIDLVLIPFPVLIASMAIGAVVFWFGLPNARLSLTTIATTYAMLLGYEWTHFLIHSTYQPRHWYYRYIWRAHRLHHFRNERYWFGVTVHAADHVLRTFPDKDAVPISATARTLGVETA